MQVAEAFVAIRPDTAGFDRQLVDDVGRAADAAGQRATRSMSESMTSAGRTMTRNFTLPLLAAGGGAVALANSFESSFSKIEGLVGVAADQVDELREGVLALSEETARGPQELADALFTVTSAGFRGAEALDVLDSAARASAAGMGETRSIAEALTGAVNAYGPEVLSAARATDVLVATARAGNFATEELASSIGQALPFAREAGASFEDMGGAVALLTRVNNNASQSLTQITALFRSLAIPTAQATTILGKYGISLDDIRQTLRQQGLPAALQRLEDALGGNREELARIIGTSEGTAAAYQILNASAEDLDSTFGAVADSTGILGDAFSKVADDDGFKARQELARVQASAIELGGQLAPLAARILGFGASLLGAFTDLPPEVQTAALAVLGLTAALGPALTLAGNAARAYRGLATAIGFLATTQSAAALTATGLGAALAGALVIFGTYRGLIAAATRDQENYDQAQAKTVNDLALLKLGVDQSSDALREQAVANFIAAKALEGNLDTTEGLTRQNEELTRKSEAAVTVITNLADASGVSAERVAQLASEMGINLGTASDEAKERLAGALSEIGRAVTPTERLSAVTETLGNDFATTAEQVGAFEEAVNALLGSFLSAEEAEIRLREEVRRLHREFADGSLKGGDFAETQDRMRQRAIALTREVENTVAALVRDERITSDAATQKAEMIRRLQELQRQFPPLAGELQRHIDLINAIPDEKTTDVRVRVFSAELDQLSRGLTALANTGVLVQAAPGTVVRRQHGGPLHAGQLARVNETGTELFVPHTAGSVVSNDRLMAVLEELLGRTGGSSEPIVMGEGSIVVHNPAPERASTSIVRQLRTQAHLLGRR